MSKKSRGFGAALDAFEDYKEDLKVLLKNNDITEEEYIELLKAKAAELDL